MSDPAVVAGAAGDEAATRPTRRPARNRRTPRILAAALGALAPVLLLAGPAMAEPPSPVSFHSFALLKGALSLPQGTLPTTTYPGPDGGAPRTYEYDSWVSPSFTTPAPFTELVASWNAQTPAGTWLAVSMRATTSTGSPTKWYELGHWTYDDSQFRRTSIGGQGDGDGDIAVDTFVAREHPMTAYQLRATLYRPPGTQLTPTVTALGAVVSSAANAQPSIPSATTMTGDRVLPVPAYSQEIHTGEYPQFDGGGEAWCGPTALSMVLRYWGKGPSPRDYAYVQRDYPAVRDPWVDHAARFTFDYRYQGAGNWPFNTAYAAHFGLAAQVTRLHSLAEAEQFVKAGIPLVASVRVGPKQLDGFPLDEGMDGHLLVIVGFKANGDVVVNDPAAPSDAAVQRVYHREQFERVWVSGSRGTVYVVYPQGVPLPASPLGNW